MRFLHLSDLHFGVKLSGRDVVEDQRFVWDQIFAQIADRRPDAVLIAGDVYDRSDPSIDAIREFQTFLSGLRSASEDAEIMIVSGNHDNSTRLDQYRPILERQKVRMIGEPPVASDDFIEKVTLNDEYGPVDFYLLPFVKSSWIKEIVGQDESGSNLSIDAAIRRLLEREKIDFEKRNVVVSHQYYTNFKTTPVSEEDADYIARSIGNEDPVSGEALRQFDYAALGHIHKPSTLGDEYHRYCGTPMAYSLNEVGQTKHALWIEMREKGDVEVEQVELKPLRKIVKLSGTIDELCELGKTTEYGQCYVGAELVGQNDSEIGAGVRLKEAFPYLLSYQWKDQFTTEYEVGEDDAEQKTPFEMCKKFLNDDLSPEEEELLKEIVAMAEGTN